MVLLALWTVLSMIPSSAFAQIEEVPETAPATNKELVLEVKAKRKPLEPKTSTSSVQVTQDEIRQLPQGDETTLPRLISTTTPGVVSGAFGQMFIRGNHANIQYQIDGVQLPESPSNTFGEAFSPRNIDHMEVITGGIPAEYGERLAAVVNIVTKSGPETPGGRLHLDYGTYNRTSPTVTFGGSNARGDVHYYLAAGYNRTDRGLDTPQPESEHGQTQGGTEAIHDKSWGTSEFAKIDWVASNTDKLALVLFHSQSYFEIPNYPGSFQAGDAFFGPGFVDQFGNVGSFSSYTPPNTDDRQLELNDYVQLFWKHTLSDRVFLAVAPYWKYSFIHYMNDPANDLIAIGAIPGSNPASFYEDRHVNNFGLKSDAQVRVDERNLVRAGVQTQYSRADGVISVIATSSAPPPATVAFTDASPGTGVVEAAYVQDELAILKPLVLSAGVRFDATQFLFSGARATDWSLGPRIGLSYMLTDSTKLHVFYGRLFQPASLENLRDAFTTVGGATFAPYDIKAEKDNYYEAGVAQELPGGQTAMVNAYYKSAINMLDDAQLLNTPIAQPYNFAQGYAWGLEASVRGQITPELSDYVNYSYEIAKGRGISGGIFAFPPGQAPGKDYQFLDHVQKHTVSSGFTYARSGYWGTVQGLYGSGLRTGPNNNASLPDHFTMDLTAGYEFRGGSWLTRFKLSGDVLNVFNNVYPITVANGFNGSHYAAGRVFVAHLVKEL